MHEAVTGFSPDICTKDTGAFCPLSLLPAHAGSRSYRAGQCGLPSDIFALLTHNVPADAKHKAEKR